MVDLSAKVIKYLEANGKTANEIGPYFENPNVAITDDGTGAIIKIWKEEELGVARPTDEQLNAVESEANELEAANQVIANRKAEYPSIEELVVALYDSDDKAAVDEKRAAIKLKYSKP